MKNLFKKLQKVNIVKSLNLQRFTMPVIILMSVVIFIASNMLLSQVSFRLDLSQGKAYTLTSSSKKVINDLKKPVTLTFFVSKDIPAGLQPLKREVIDLLQEYDRSSSKVILRIQDPKSDDAAKKKAQEAGIPELPFQQMKQNKYEVISTYFGILIEYDKAKETLPQVTDVEGLEYNITAAIYKMTRTELPQVAIMGYDTQFMPQGDELGTLKKVLASQFDVQPLSAPAPTPTGEAAAPTGVPEKFTINPSIKTVMAFAPPGKVYSAEEIAEMKKYLNNKGKMIVLANGVTVEDSIQTSPASPELMKLLKDYGLELQSDLILSTSAEVVNMGSQNFSLMMAYPMWLRTNQFNQKSSYFSNISFLTYPWGSSIKAQSKSGFEPTELVQTPQESWAQKGSFTLDPQQIPQPTQQDINRFIVTAETKKKDGGALMLIGSSRFVSDRYLSQRANNIEFILNVLNDYASGGALSGIRQRAVSLYPLPDLPQQFQSVFQYVNILFLPGIFGLYGLVRLYRRSKSIAKN